LRIGLVDRPDSQSQEPLELDLAEGGTWLAVGGARSGRTTLLRTVLGEAVHRLGPDRLNVHLVEAGAGPLAADVAALPHAGTVVSADDAHRTVRLMDRLAQEVAARRTGARSEDAPLVLLLIDGVETISTLLDEADPSRGSAGLLRLLRDGSAVGLTAVVTADRAVPGGRLAAVARQRLVLPLPDRADYAIAGIPARDVPNRRPQGRALLGEEALECQLALPRPLEKPPASPSARWASLGALRIVELPPDPAVELPHSDSGIGSEATLALRVGPGGDEGGVLVVDLMRTGGLLVTGPPGSGRTSALDAFARHLVAAGSRVLRVGGRGGPRGAEGGDGDAVWLDAHDCAGVNEWLADLNGRPGVVIADDLGAPGDAPALAGLPAPNSPRAALVAAGSPGQLSGHFQGPVASLRRARTGLLLCPGPGDADLLGIRLPRTPVPTRPGSGWLVTGGVVDRVQVARRRLPPDRAAG
jgi:S-DNA-T family DNA segregation ATPase FtsK/SpoIIIE